MAHEDLSTRKKILDTAVKLLFTASREELTTRRIAEAAGVNIAAINYHFRSKEELIDQAVEAATADAFEKGMTILFAAGKPPRQRLRDFISGYAYGLMKFPGLTRTSFLTLFLKEGGGTIYGRYMKEMLEKVGQVIAEARGPAAEEDVRSAAHQIRARSAALMVLSCAIFPFLVSNAVREAGGIDYADDAARNLYIETMLARLVQ
ncbi:MAG: TetR/AcrR family transcriptional regulator [Spirochaetia bacterium]|jgi:AcrR family transcriptional regulator